MKKHRLVTLLLAVVMLLGLTFSANVSADTVGEFGEISEEFENFLKFPNLGGKDSKNGLVPSIKEINTNRKELNRFNALRGTRPARFDLRETGRWTPVRDQGPNGSCWAFACYGALESYLRPVRYYDFSEKHMRNVHGFDFAPDRGGNREMSTAYLARWQGPVAEKDDPYDPYNFNSKPVLPRQQDLIHALWLPGRANAYDNDVIKDALMKYGAVSTIIQGSDRYLNRKTNAFYDTSGNRADHAVTIIGWDDNFSRYNFLTAPASDGAFIVKNSWGEGWGERGVYYVSYHDHNIGAQNTVYISEDMGKRDSIWQYDWLGMTNDYGFGKNSAYMANVFGPVQKDTYINSVGFYATSNGCQYEVYINADASTSNIDGGKKLVASGRFEYAGYHVVDFDAVKVARGKQFAPIVKVTTPGYNYPIAIEQPHRGFSSQARANRGEGFVSETGSNWADMANLSRNTSVCLKAFGGPVGGYTPDPYEPDEPDEPVTKELKVSASARHESYLPGETVYYDIEVKDENGKAVSGAKVQAKITDPNYDTYTGEFSTNYKGQVAIDAKLADNAVEGKYKLEVEVSKYGYPTAKAEAYAVCKHQSTPQPDPQLKQLNVELYPDQATYKVGQSAYFRVKVTDENGYAVYNANIEGELNTPDGQSYKFTRSTNYYGSTYIKMTTNEYAAAGKYTVNIKVSKDGYQTVQAEAYTEYIGNDSANKYQISVTGSTSYRRGDKMQLTFTVKNPDGSNARWKYVNFEIVQPNGKVLTHRASTDSLGRINLGITTGYSSDAGNYKVIAKVGYGNEAAETSVICTLR